MKSKVYFAAAKDANDIRTVNGKLKRLLEKSRVLDFIQKEYRVAIKIHFGEEGNTGFVKPEHVRLVCAAISDKGAKAFLAETNTLYKGRRTNSREHLLIAAEHGFRKEITGAEIVIPDDSQKKTP